MNKPVAFLSCAIASALLSFANTAGADVTVAGPFSDHMVLQQAAKVPIWGTATAGETIHVSLKDQSVAATADATGAWKAELTNLPVGGPYEVTVASDKNTITLQDVLVGDVWLCSGQSNMGFGVADSLHGKDEVAAADHPMIRLLNVPQGGSPEPKTAMVKPAAWKVCSPQTVSGFSGAAYFFGRELNKQLNIPIGLIHSSYGGTPAEAWTSREALDAVPSLKEFSEAQIALLATAQDNQAKFAAELAAWEKKWNVEEPENTGFKNGWAAVDCDTSDWKKVSLGITYEAGLGMKSGGSVWFRKEVDLPESAAGKSFRFGFGWLAEQYHTVYFNGKQIDTFGRTPPAFYTGGRAATVPADLVKAGRNVIAIRFVTHTQKAGFFIPGRAMQLPVTDAGSVDNTWLAKVETLFPPLPPEALTTKPKVNLQSPQLTAANLYNAMINPLMPYGIKGAIWYQGENNNGRAFEYRTLLPTLIRDWRQRWGQGDFPFYIQQLVNFGDPATTPGQSTWAELREAQWMTAKSEPNAGLSCGIDIGDSITIHPLNKQEVGRRLALVALAKTYGQAVEFSGPEYKDMKIEGSTIRLTFDHADGLKSADGKPPARFEIAGEDKKFVWADATIDGASIVVTSSKVAAPVAVRYAWANNPAGVNVVNGAGLPALPFRTDTWTGVTESAKWQPQ